MPLQLASDNFNRANEDPLSGGGNWLITTGATGMQITSDFVSCISIGGATNYEYYNGSISWPNDQYSQITLRTNVKSASTNSGSMVRASATANTMYSGQVVNGNVVIGKSVAGTFTQLSSVAYSFTNGDVMFFEAVGTTINLLMNNSQKATATDGAITSGFPAFYMLTSTGMTGNVNSSNWSGGAADLGSAATQVSPIII